MTKERPTSGMGEHVLFFGDDRRTVVAIDVRQEAWGSVLQEESELEGQFVHFLLMHLVLRSTEPVRRRYHVVSSKALSSFRSNAERRHDWEWLGDFGMRFMSNGFQEQDTVVVPYLDHDHWTLFIIGRDETYHVGCSLHLHDNSWGDDFATLLHIAFTATLRLKPGTDLWWKLVCRRVKQIGFLGCPSSWESGYAMCYLFWQLLCHRGADRRKQPPTPSQWVPATGRDMQVWFVECLWRELMCRDLRYDAPRMCTPEEEIERSWDVSDLPIYPEPADRTRENAGGYGISTCLVDMRPLRQFSIQRPPNPSVEEEAERVRRLAAESELRTKNRESLSSLLQRKVPPD